MTTQTSMVDEARLGEFVGKVATELAGASSVALVRIGDKLGLYQAIADAGPVNSVELAQRTGTVERYVREWLVNQAAGGYLEYNPATERYSLPAENAVVLLDKTSPYYLAGAFQLVMGMQKAEEQITQAFRNGGGIFWGDQHSDLIEGTRRFFGPSYHNFLTSNWIPALEGMQAKLDAGAKVADLGCGLGTTTILIAKAFPASEIYGFDYDAGSIELARQAAKEAGITRHISFDAVSSTDYPNRQYDLIAMCDCLHDMANPVNVARYAFQCLKDDGAILVVEPMAAETTEDNFNPVGRIYSAASTLCCTPNALAGGGPALGTLATAKKLEEVFTEAGFSQFCMVTQTPFNRVFAVRK